MEKREELYRGKAKSVYKTDDANRLILLFRNDTSAFDGKRIEQLDRKGMVNNKFNAFIMQKLEAAGVPTQFDKLLGDNECLVKKLDMIPVECVVRNYAAGSLVKRLGVEEGMKLNPYTFELFLKDDAKGDLVHQRIPRRGVRLGHRRATGSHEGAVAQGQRSAEQTVRRRRPAAGRLQAGIRRVPRWFHRAGRRIQPGRLPSVGQGYHARRWTRTASVRASVTSSKPTKKSPIVWAYRFNRRKHLIAQKYFAIEGSLPAKVLL